ncbi:MAG: hypothetical protein M0R03_00615 [Novosphingobium sp.]|nr:hypothetical protein [Novosphingobium sp.]
MARLFLSSGETYGTVGGFQSNNVFGTQGAETVYVSAEGKAIFDPTFKDGGDVINIGGQAGIYDAFLLGTSLVLVADNGARIEIPFGNVGATINFADVSRVLVINGPNSILLGDQEIFTTATQDNPVDVNPAAPLPGNTYLLLPTLDNLTGTAGNDTFLADKNTLNTGDILNGLGGNDTLVISVGGDGYHFSAPTLNSVETVRVNAPNVPTANIVIDLSNSDGVNTLQSYQTTSFGGGAGLVQFLDIQNVNGTKIDIIDTNVDHVFTYDAVNAYQAGSLNDIADIRLQEVRWSNIYLGNQGFDSYSSDVEVVNLTSAARPGQVSSTAENLLDSLWVGSDFDTLNIFGDDEAGHADLVIWDVLDVNVRVIDAGTLDADLALWVNTDADNDRVGITNTRMPFELFEYTGALQSDSLYLERTGNADIDLNSGDDWLHVDGNGNLTVVGGTGNDFVEIHAYTDDGIDDGRHDISLGDGDDWLEIAGLDEDGYFAPASVNDYDTLIDGDGVTTVDAGAGNDSVAIYSYGDYDIALGDGDDDFLLNDEDSIYGDNTIDAGAGNDVVVAWNVGTSVADLGAGNDFFAAIGHGVRDVVAGAGDDTVYIHGDGDHTVQGNDGNDRVYIGLRDIDLNGVNESPDQYSPAASTPNLFDYVLPYDGHLFESEVVGRHDVDLGAGDDFLLINGPRVPDGNIDNDDPALVSTRILGGDGNDTVVVTADHYLETDLGAGNDLIDIRAKDLSVDDTIAGGAGRDTLVLRNDSYSPIDGRVLQSETVHTTGFEVYDLRNNNITLAVTNNIIETAEDKNFTVITEHADTYPLPSLTLLADASTTVAPFFNGMTQAQMEAVATDWRNGVYLEAAEYINAWGTGTNPPPPIAATQQAIYDYYEQFGTDADELAQAMTDLINWIDLEIEFNVPNSVDESEGQYFFVADIPGAQTIDITNITTPQYFFTLEGGNVRDIVIADDDSINSRSTLRFDSLALGANSIEDTLRVVDGAEITAADLRNVTGLERIELVSTGSSGPQTWSIALTDKVIDQTTGDAPLIIHVDDDIPAGSELYITLDASVPLAWNNVFIERNANVKVYIDGVLVTEPDFNNTDYNSGPAVIRVVNQLNFTATGDNLVGGDGNDTFFSASLDFIESGDSAEGNDGFDTLLLDFAVNNPTATLEDIFEGANIVEIEKVQFDTGNNVRFDGIGAGYMTDLEIVETGSGNDELTFARQGLLYQLNAGNDLVELAPDNGPSYTTVEGGAGLDSVEGSTSGDEIEIDSVEYVDGNGGSDVVRLASSASNAPGKLLSFLDVETVNGSDESDNIHATSAAGAVEVNGGDGNDTIRVGGGNPFYTGLANTFAADVTVSGGDGDDLIYVDASDVANVSGGDGNDTIDVHAYDGANGPGGNSGGDVTVNGGDGDDLITVSAEDDVSVLGGAGNDTITVAPRSRDLNGDGDTVDANEGTVTVEDTYVDGGSGNDVINVTVDDDLNVHGGSGNDTIVATFHNINTSSPTLYVTNVSTVTGGDGDDSITVNLFEQAGSVASQATVDGGAGNDHITINYGAGTDIAAGLDHTATVSGGDGNDTIVANTIADTATTIIGGAGNDVITLLATSESDGFDEIIFGNIAYNFAQVKTTDTQGLDTITGFVFEDPIPGDPAPDVGDSLNFTAFLGTQISGDNLVTAPVPWTGGAVAADNAEGPAIVVLSRAGYTLSAADFGANGTGGPIQIHDNGKAVVVVQTAPAQYDVYYVQDISSGAGQTWAVDKVAAVTGSTAVGIEEVMDNLLDGLTVNNLDLQVLSASEAGLTVLGNDLGVVDSNQLSLVTYITAQDGAAPGDINDGSPTNLAVTVPPVAGSHQFIELVLEDNLANTADSGYTLVRGLATDSELNGADTAQVAAGRSGIFYGFGGDDTIRGTEGADSIFGGAGNDHIVIVGSVGSEYLPVAPAPGLGGVEGNLLLARAGTDVVAGDYINGGLGTDTLHVFGTANLSLVNGGGSLLVETLTIYSNVTLTREQLFSLDTLAVEGDAPHYLTITGLNPGETQQQAFEAWLAQAGHQAMDDITGSEVIIVGGQAYTAAEIEALDDEVVGPPADVEFDVGTGDQSVAGDPDIIFTGTFSGAQSNNSIAVDLDGGVLDLSAFTWLTGGIEENNTNSGTQNFNGTINPLETNKEYEVNLNGKLALLSGNNLSSVDEASEIANRFGDDEPFDFTSAGDDRALVISGSSSSSTAYLWYINSDNGTINTNEVHLIATINLGTGYNITSFEAANFAFA